MRRCASLTEWRYARSARLALQHTDPAAATAGSVDRPRGIVEVWFDNAADAMGLSEHPGYRDDLVPDEPTFIDMDGLRVAFTEETVIESGHDPRTITGEADLEWDPDARPTSIKLIRLATAAMPDSGGPDGTVGPARRLGVLRHVRCTPAAALHPEGADFAAIDELWWPTLTALRAGVRNDRAAWEQLTEQAGVASVVVRAERFL